MGFKTIEDDHSHNMDELLTYLCQEQDSRKSLSIANLTLNPDRSKSEQVASEGYRRMYLAARHYRKSFDIL